MTNAADGSYGGKDEEEQLKELQAMVEVHSARAPSPSRPMGYGPPILLLLAIGAALGFVKREALADVMNKRFAGSGQVLVASEDREEEDESGADCAPENSASGRASGGGAKKWKVTVELGGETVKLTVAKGSVQSPDELRQAILESCLANLGADVVPSPWLNEYEGLLIQYLDDEEDLLQLDDDTDISGVVSARTLYVRNTAAPRGSGRP